MPVSSVLVFFILTQVIAPAASALQAVAKLIVLSVKVILSSVKWGLSSFILLTLLRPSIHCITVGLKKIKGIEVNCFC